jgi:hypothetical protein
LTDKALDPILVDMNGTNRSLRYESVKNYIEENGFKKGFIAERWGISRFQMTALLHPGRYPVSLSDEQVAAIARDLRQSPAFVRRLLVRAA